MRSDWSPEELISSWTLEEADWRLLANKTGSTRLGFAVLLRFLELEGRFPRTPTRFRRLSWTTLPARSRWTARSLMATGRGGR